MADLDLLQVKISGDSADASLQIDKLVGSLTALKAITKGGAGLTTIANQITKLKTALSGVPLETAKITELKTVLGSLGTIPKASGLASTINTLKKLPDVTESLDKLDLTSFSNQIQRLSKIMAPLATQMSNISAGFASLPKNIKKATATAAGFTASTKSMAGGLKGLIGNVAIGVVLQKAVQGISGAIKKSTEYVENMNLFTVAMGDYADEAFRYAEEVSSVMGIDPSDWMRAQGVFMTLGTGFGVSADKAALMSQNLTQLGYDISSFFNISVEDAMQKLQSGISGELEPLRRLGYDLSQARLEAIALSLGIDKSVSSMTQAEKAQLRYYAIMTQVTTAQGDMARTLDQPANQLRIFSAALNQTARAIGNIFIPALNKILPYAIAVVKVVQWVAQSIANLFGFEMPTVDYSGIGSVTAGAEEAEDALDGATGAAKELKRQVMGFDELNILNDPNTGGGGGGASGVGGDGFDFELPTYDFLGGAVDSKVTQIFEDIKGTIEDIIDLVPDEKFEAIADSFDSLKESIERLTKTPGWKTLEDIFKRLAALNIEIVLTSFENLLGTVSSVFEVVNAIFSFDFSNFGESFWELDEAMDTLAGHIKTLMGGLPAIIGKVLTEKFKKTEFFNTLSSKFEETRKSIEKKWERFSEWFETEVFDPIINLALNFEEEAPRLLGEARSFIEQKWQSLSSWFSENVFTPIGNRVQEVREKISLNFINAWTVVENVWKGVGEWFDINVRQPIVNKFNQIITPIYTAFSTAWASVRGIWENVVYWFKQNVIWPMENMFSSMSFNLKLPHLYVYWDSDISTAIGKAANFLFGRYAIPKIGVSWKYYEDGGYGIPEGQLFIANEAGPELVGQMNGRNTVANQAQIIEGIRQATYEGFMAAMASAGNGQGNQHITVQVGDETLADVVVHAVNKQTRELGYLALEGI